MNTNQERMILYERLFIDYLLKNDILKDEAKDKLFEDWHNHRYLKQCLYNLEEKYDCGGISREEWIPIYNKFHYKNN